METEIENEKGGLDAALEASGAGVKIGGKTVPLTEVQQVPNPPVKPTPEQVEAFLNFVDVVTVQICRGVSIVYKVPFTDDMRKSCTLSKVEREELEMTAEPAFPYIDRFLRNSALIGLGLFLLSYGDMLHGKAKAVADKAPKKPKEGAKKPGRPPKAATAPEPSPGV